MSYFLRLDQAKNLMLNDKLWKIPPTLERSVLFTNEGKTNLEERKKELRENIRTIGKERSKLEETKKNLEREKGILIKAHKEALAECEEIYQLKFGERIPQEILDGLEPTQKLKSLQREFEKEEKLSVRKLKEAEEQLKTTMKTLLEAREKNTAIINYITKKGNEQLKLNKVLDSTINNITVGLN